VCAIQLYVCGHEPYIALVCTCLPYSAMSAGEREHVALTNRWHA
jgi:hypothetical protein